MKTNKRSIPALAAGVVLLAACNYTAVTPTAVANLPNPASVYCEEHGNTLTILTAADGSQSGQCIFPDGGSCDEWAYFRGECGPSAAPAATSKPAEVSPTQAADPSAYEGWTAYTDSAYGFTLMLPPDWLADETAAGDPLLGGHLLTLHPADASESESIRMTFRRVGEDVLLWPTGVGQGDFVPQGRLEVAGQSVERFYLICPSGEVTSIWYQQGEGEPNIELDGMEFAFIFSARPTHCEAGSSLSGKAQVQGERIIASLHLAD